MDWSHENPARWDADKARVLADAPGVLDGDYADGQLVPGEWWRVSRDGVVIGYGWMDVTWGYAPILLVVAASERDSGVGGWIVDRLQEEARSRGLAYIFNVVPASVPDPEAVASWLLAHGFESSQSDGRMLRRKV